VTGLAVVWLTGPSGAGKTTLARAVHQGLVAAGRTAVVLDGDDLRASLSRDLGFTKTDRDEQVRRVSELALAAIRAGEIAIVALISPYREARARARALLSQDARFVEVHVDCPLEMLLRRDEKGLYRRALSGELPAFTGISDPYEHPPRPELRIDTSRSSVRESVQQILKLLEVSSLSDHG